jgi:hypothetical protein
MLKVIRSILIGVYTFLFKMSAIFEFPHPRVAHDLSDSSHGAQPPFGVLDQESFEQHFDFWGEVDMIREVYIFVLY